MFKNDLLLKFVNIHISVIFDQDVWKWSKLTQSLLTQSHIIDFQSFGHNRLAGEVFKNDQNCLIKILEYSGRWFEADPDQEVILFKPIGYYRNCQKNGHLVKNGNEISVRNHLKNEPDRYYQLLHVRVRSYSDFVSL